MIGSSKVLNNIIVYNPYGYKIQSICPCGIKINLNVSDYYCQEHSLRDIVPIILDKNYSLYECNFIYSYLNMEYEYEYCSSILFSKKDTWVIVDAIEGFESCPVIKIEKTNDKWLKIYRGWNELDNLIYELKITNSNKGIVKKIYVKYGERIFDLINIIYLIDSAINIFDQNHVDGLSDGDVLIFDEEGLNEEKLNKLFQEYLPVFTPYISGKYYDGGIFKLTTYHYHSLYDKDLGATYLLFFEDLNCLVAIANTKHGIMVILYHDGKYRMYVLYYRGTDTHTDTCMVNKQEDNILIYFQFTNGEENCFKINIQDLIKNIDIENKEYYHIDNEKFLKCDINNIAKPLNPLKDGVCLVFSRENYRDYRVGYHNIYLHKGEIIAYEIFDMPSKITTYKYFVDVSCLNIGGNALDFTYITPKYI